MFKTNVMTCYKGRAYELGVFYIDANSNEISIAGLTGHYLRIQNQNGTFIEKMVTAGFGWGLQLNQNYLGVFAFTKDETALFKVGANQSVFLKLVYGDNVVWQEIKGYLTVLPDLF